MARLSNPEPMSAEVQRAFERIRSEKGLRLVSEEESGTGVERLPAGVYGFTYSPAEDNFPLFSDRDIRSYEAHKLRDGTVVILGFLTPEEEGVFERGRESSVVHLFPEPKGAANRMVGVPLSRIASHVENSARKGTGLEITLAPAGGSTGKP